MREIMLYASLMLIMYLHGMASDPIVDHALVKRDSRLTWPIPKGAGKPIFPQISQCVLG